MAIAQANPDEGLFGELVRAHSPRLRKACRRLAAAGEGEDLYQTALVRAWRYIRSLNDPAKFVAWFMVIARHVAFDQATARAGRPRPESLELCREWELPVEQARDQEVVDRLACGEVMRAALESLPARARRVARLRAMGLSAKEVATATGLSPANVDQVYVRTQRRLRPRIERAINDGVLGLAPMAWFARSLSRWRAAARRRAVKLGEWGRRVEVSGCGQLAVLGVAALVAAGGVGVFGQHVGPGAHGRPGRLTNGSAFGANSAGRRGRDGSGRSAGSGGSLTPRGARGSGYEVNRCAFVLSCGGRGPTYVGTRRHPDDPGFPVWIPGVGELWVDTGVHPEDAPTTPEAIQEQFLGRPDALACDASLATSGRTCDGRDGTELVRFLAEWNRQGAVGDECVANDSRGRHVPVVCDPIHPLPDNVLGPSARAR